MNLDIDLGGAASNSAMESNREDSMRLECLVRGDPGSTVTIQVRFPRYVTRDVTYWDGERWYPVSDLEIDGRRFTAMEETVAREVEIPAIVLTALAAEPVDRRFTFGVTREREILRDETGCLAGTILSTSEALDGRITVNAREIAAGIYRLCVRVVATRGESRGRSPLASMHAILRAENGEFVSLTEPPESLAEAARACVSEGCWPVLAGHDGTHDMLLSGPIILRDDPPAALFPAAPFDFGEILTRQRGASHAVRGFGIPN